MNRIQITPIGTSTANYHLAANLAEIAPKSFRKAQDVLLTAKKYAKGGSWFASERSRLQRLQQEVYLLGRILTDEGWGDRSLNKQERIFNFLNEFAHTFPNWQKEYALLNKWIPEFYADM